MNVLFIGNSYTFFHDMPGMVQSLAEGQVVLRCTHSARGGVDLRLHWRRMNSRALVQSGAFDYVVLQENSTVPLHSPLRFFRYAKCFSNEIEKYGGRVLFFQTWPRKEGHAVYQSSWSGGGPEAMLGQLRACYKRTANWCHGMLVPVGDYWWESLIRFPEIELYDSDAHHASLAGAFVSACAFAKAFGVDIRESSFVPEGLNVDDARRIKAVVTSFSD